MSEDDLSPSEPTSPSPEPTSPAPSETARHPPASAPGKTGPVQDRPGAGARWLARGGAGADRVP